MAESFDATKIPEQSPCPFCVIATAYSPYDPRAPPPARAAELNPAKVAPASFVCLSTPDVLAFLDIMPLSFGHLLLCPRRHAVTLKDISTHEASELGIYLRLLSKALTRATGVKDWNVVQNNGAAAAQVVNHVHYHLIPRPEIRASGRYSESFTMFGRGKREELDDDEAVGFAATFREVVKEVLEEEVISKSKL